MGSKPGKVIDPVKSVASGDCPHVSGNSSMEMLTVLYSASAEGQLMPPFFIYPEPKPTSYDPMIGAQRGSTVVYIKKGWMNYDAFCTFLDHFNKYATSSPVDWQCFVTSKYGYFLESNLFTDRNLQINSKCNTHLVQPLDKGVFGPL